ncbi:hypothetical protein TIFTF001_004965 [Ficus carica]|uniref:MATH domain-containing protein n=1 Tax=Ficus carica TaxID=3494 RepID=A0AA87ZHU4_FICCA|nr:hypothetical protein TIFTF001_004965 [Ficus carica]
MDTRRAMGRIMSLSIWHWQRLIPKRGQMLDQPSVRRFHEMKTTWGFAQLLPLETFEDPSNGYLIDDTCVFGVEVFVIKHTGNSETLSLAASPDISNATFTWEIDKFSDLDKELYNSIVFTVKREKLVEIVLVLKIRVGVI